VVKKGKLGHYPESGKKIASRSHALCWAVLSSLLALLLIPLDSCHDLDVKIPAMIAVPQALAGHETLLGEVSR